MLKKSFLKNFLSLVVLALVMFILAGCKKDDKIELSFAQSSYDVIVGEELELQPEITKGKDVKEVKLVYSSENEEVATYVDGKVTGVAVGETKVKVAVDGRPTVYKEVTIKVVPQPSFTINYHLNGGTNASENPTSYTAGDLPITLAAPTREGYTFKGWFDNETLAGEAITEIPAGATGNKDLYAKWEENTYTITYHLDEGTNAEDNPTTFKVSALPITLKDATKAGYKFIGWFDNENFAGNKITQITTGTAKDVVLYAKFEKIYNITYNLNEGTLPAGAPTSFTASDLEFNLPTPTREGYDFVGWYTTADFSGDAVAKITTVGDVVLYAKWAVQIKTYEIVYHLNEGTLPEGAPTHYKENETLTLPIPTKEGFKFMGWYTDPDFDGEAVTIIPAGSSGVKTFYARFVEVVVYSVEYHIDGGLFISNLEDLKNELLRDYYDFLKPSMDYNTFAHGEGKTSGFQGPWATPNSGTFTIVNLYQPGGSKDPNPNSEYFINKPEYNAKWLPFFELLDTMVTETNATQNFWGSSWTGNIRFREFMVGTRYNDAESAKRYLALNVIPRSLVTEYDSLLTEAIDLIVPAKEGYIFGGWYTNDEFTGNPITKIEPGMTGNLILYAKWNPIMHKITFDVEGEKTEVEVENGKPVTKPTDPVKEGFDFIGWYLGEQKFNFETAITGPITLVARFKEIDYANVTTIEEFKAALANEKIKFIYLENDLVSDEKKLLLNRDGVIIDGQGHTISYANQEGWNSEYILHIYRAKDVVIKNIKLTGGDAAILINSSEVTLEGQVDVSGHEFGGIELSQGQGVEELPKLTLAEGLVLINDTEAYGQPTIWEDLVTNTLVGGDDLHANSEIREGQVQYYLDIKNAAETIWKVTFQIEEDETQVVEVKDGDKVTLITPTKEGFKFLGWFLGEEKFDANTPIIEDITLVAKWEEVVPVLPDAKAALQAIETIPTYFPYGMFDGNKLLDFLPTELEGFPTVTIKWSGDSNEFTEDLVLKKQRMLYYETTVIATLESEGETPVTVEFKVNIGLVEKPAPQAYGISQTSRAGATSFDVNAYNAENGFGNKFDGGTNITGRTFTRFSGLIFKSNFTWGTVTADFYLFIRAGNIANVNENHLTQEGDKYRVTGSTLTSWHESSFARIVYNNTDKDGVIAGDQLKTVLNLQGHNAYHVWIIDGEGNITLKHTGTQPAFEYVIPAGGYIIERGFIDGSASNSGNVTAAVLGFFQNATKVDFIKVAVHSDHK